MTHHRFATVDGHQLFYREAGSPELPTIVLLHGTPASSFMFRELIPQLSDRYHVIAPDMLGFGFSDMPTVEEFTYTFEALADLTRRLLDQLGVGRFAMYVQDYGAPLGWRLAVAEPERITAIVSQNGNGYEAGFVPDFWAPLWRYAKDGNPVDADALRNGLSLESIKWQYTHGVPDPSVVSPDAWQHDTDLVNRPGNLDLQLELFADYPNNAEFYPQLHAYLRSSQVPLLAIWGENDEIFGPDGARAFTQDDSNAVVKLIDGGHFLLESAVDEVATEIRSFLQAGAI